MSSSLNPPPPDPAEFQDPEVNLELGQVVWASAELHQRCSKPVQTKGAHAGTEHGLADRNNPRRTGEEGVYPHPHKAKDRAGQCKKNILESLFFLFLGRSSWVMRRNFFSEGIEDESKRDLLQAATQLTDTVYHIRSLEGRI